MSTSKLDVLVHYVITRCEDPTKLGATKLNKILWYSDVFCFAATGASITGAVYIKRQFGPVPKEIMQSRARLKSAGSLVERTALFRGYPQIQFFSLIEPDISIFSPQQISVVDSVLHEICYGHTAGSISHASHDVVWEIAEIGEEIPMSAAAFAGNEGEVDEDDIAWARGEIEHLEKVQPQQ